MRINLTRIFLAQFFLFSIMAAPLAQNLPVASVAVIDYAKILQNADAAKDVSLQIQQYQNKFSDEVRADELRLRAIEVKLKRERGRLSPKEFKIRQQDFRNQVLAAQKRGQDRKRQLDRALKHARGHIQKTIIPLVQAMTNEYGYSLVVDKSQVLFASRMLEITDEILVKLNQKLRTIKVPKPQ